MTRQRHLSCALRVVAVAMAMVMAGAAGPWASDARGSEITGRWFLKPLPSSNECEVYYVLSLAERLLALEGEDSRGNVMRPYFEPHEGGPFGRRGILILYPAREDLGGLGPTAVRQVIPPEVGSPFAVAGAVRTYVIFDGVARGATLGAADRLYRCPRITTEELRRRPAPLPVPPLDRELNGF